LVAAATGAIRGQCRSGGTGVGNLGARQFLPVYRRKSRKKAPFSVAAATKKIPIGAEKARFQRRILAKTVATATRPNLSGRCFAKK
jgi:hypothetical protein